jgi:hypothetical protein
MRAGRGARQWKNPDTLAMAKPSASEINRLGCWTTVEREMQDAAFRLAMSNAVECGLEHCATEPSTHFGTRAPIAGYQRD